MKRKLTMVAVLAICLSLLTYGTVAFFTAEDQAHNVITTGSIDIQLDEWADADKTVPFPEDGVSNVMPGAEVTKIVEVTNKGENAAWIRVNVDKAIELAEGVEGKVDLDLVGLDVNEEHWTLGEDGFYYYKEALEPGKTTEPLFTAVSFDKDMDNLYQNATVQVDVKAYATQVANNGSSALDATGWPAE